jgi:hypothetical protein
LAVVSGDHTRRAQPNAYLGRKPSYDRATFDRIRLALNSASPPTLSAIAKVEGLSKQAMFRLKQDPPQCLLLVSILGANFATALSRTGVFGLG